MTRSTSFFILGLALGMVAAGGCFAWLGQNSKDSSLAGGRVLKVAHSLPTSHPVHHGLEFMAQRVDELSNGTLTLKVFPNEQLGSETECLEKVQTGTLDITKTSSAPIGNFVPIYQVFSLPYLFRDEAHFWATLDGEIGREMLERISTQADGQATGLQGLGYFDSGSRSFYAGKPILTPSDLKGMKVRVMNDQVAMDMVQAMGGSPTPIAYGELYTALKQGTVDGAENNPPSFVTSRHYEIAKHYSLDHHARIPDVIVMSMDVWNTLSAEQQGWIKQAVEEASEFQRTEWQKETDKCLAQLKEAGVNIVEPKSELFRQATESVRQKYATGEIGTMVERITKLP